MGLDPLDIIALILGVWFTIRKLDAQSRQASGFPHVPARDFAAWQKLETHVYQVAALACFGKVVLDLGFTYTLARSWPPQVVWPIGAVIDLSWLAVVILSFVRARRARHLRQQLGIYLGSVPTASGQRDGEAPPDDDSPFEGASSSHDASGDGPPTEANDSTEANRRTP